MGAMESQLRETYRRWDTDLLVELRARGGLTDIASRILQEELSERDDVEVAVATQALTASSPPPPQDGELPLASLFRRFVAACIDSYGLVIVLVVLNSPFLGSKTTEFGVFCLLGSAFGFVTYYFLKDGVRGQSIGKRLLKIRVVEYGSGKPCNLFKSFVRSVVGMLGLIDLLPIFGARRQRLADRIANTIVIRA